MLSSTRPQRHKSLPIVFLYKVSLFSPAGLEFSISALAPESGGEDVLPCPSSFCVYNREQADQHALTINPSLVQAELKGNRAHMEAFLVFNTSQFNLPLTTSLLVYINPLKHPVFR